MGTKKVVKKKKSHRIAFKKKIDDKRFKDLLREEHYLLRSMGICIQPVDVTNNTVTIYIKQPCKFVISMKD